MLRTPTPLLRSFHRCMSDAPRRITPRVVDLRSDTVTKPTASMTIAMMDALVGDDVFGEDPTVNQLEKKAADMFGKEAALYLPSGTMGNVVSLAAHCGRGEEAVLGTESHIYRYEAGGSAALLGIPLFPIQNDADGTIPLAELKDCIKPDDPHFTVTKLVCLENTANRCQGAVLPSDYVDEVAKFCADNGLSLHLDGARVMNAVVALKSTPQDVLAPYDSASICLSKALGAPVGSVVVGSGDFIYRARRARKMLGGGMRQAGVIAAAGIVALDEHVDGLANDHRNAKYLAKSLAVSPGIILDPSTVQTNIVYFDMTPELNGKDGRTAAEEVVARVMETHSVRICAYGTHRLRAVTHHQVSSEMMDEAVEAITQAVGELMNEA